MSLIRRVMGGLLGRSMPTLQQDLVKPGNDRHTSAMPHELAQHIQRLNTFFGSPCTSREHALEAIASHAVPLLEACAQTRNREIALNVEALVYDRLIKSFEDSGHYDACLRLIEEPLYRLGTAWRTNASPPPPGTTPERLLFLVHNLQSDLAHVTLMCDVLDAYLAARPEQARSLAVIGAARHEPSERMRRLSERFGVDLFLARSNNHGETCETAAGMVDRGQTDRVIVVAPPLGLAYLSGRLRPHQLAWWSMKFELGCFSRLALRCSFCAGFQEVRTVAGVPWHRAPPLFSVNPSFLPSPSPPAVLTHARQHRHLFYTVNREEKIRSPLFLDMVCDVLQALPEAGFVWTGRARLEEIDEHFTRRGVAERCHFAGWIVPDDLLAIGDVFLDTPTLSGTVAARAAAAGLPVITLTDSQSWVNFFMGALRRDRAAGAQDALADAVAALEARDLNLECATTQSYVRTALTIATDAAARADYTQALRLFAQKYFFRTEVSAAEHLENLRAQAGAGSRNA